MQRQFICLFSWVTKNVPFIKTTLGYKNHQTTLVKHKEINKLQWLKYINLLNHILILP